MGLVGLSLCAFQVRSTEGAAGNQSNLGAYLAGLIEGDGSIYTPTPR